MHTVYLLTVYMWWPPLGVSSEEWVPTPWPWKDICENITFPQVGGKCKISARAQFFNQAQRSNREFRRQIKSYQSFRPSMNWTNKMFSLVNLALKT